MGDERVFKGVYIPAEIFLAKELSPCEKIILAEIDSFTGNNKCCFKTNKTFSEDFQISERQVSRSISILIKHFYVKKVKFDGKKRYLQSIGQVERYKLLKAEEKKKKKNSKKSKKSSIANMSTLDSSIDKLATLNPSIAKLAMQGSQFGYDTRTMTKTRKKPIPKGLSTKTTLQDESCHDFVIKEKGKEGRILLKNNKPFIIHKGTDHMRIRRFFLYFNESGYKQYAKEGKAVKALLEEKARDFNDDPDLDAIDFLASYIYKFHELKFKSKEKFWNDQPFLPSILNSQNLWNRIHEFVTEDKEKEQEELARKKKREESRKKKKQADEALKKEVEAGHKQEITSFDEYLKNKKRKTG